MMEALLRSLRVLAISDTHAPWVNDKLIEKIYKVIENQPFDVIIQLGDLYDMYSHSKFARSHDICTPKEEIEEGYLWAQNFWKNINKINSKARKIQLKGNHDDRLSRAEHSLYQFRNVETVNDSRDGIEIEDVVYLHGYLSKLGDHTKHLLKNVVHAHTHKGGSIFYKLGGKILWELDCGFSADQNKVPLQYGPTKTTLWTPGYGIIDCNGPRFIPFENSRVLLK